MPINKLEIKKKRAIEVLNESGLFPVTCINYLLPKTKDYQLNVYFPLQGTIKLEKWYTKSMNLKTYDLISVEEFLEEVPKEYKELIIFNMDLFGDPELIYRPVKKCQAS